MKRCIATLLTLGMILSLAGCTKESEETKKKKKKKKATSDTEITETEETDETDTSDTTELTDDTTVPVTPSAPAPISLSHDLTALQMDSDTLCRAYAAMTRDFSPNKFFQVDYQCDITNVSTPGYEALTKQVATLYENVEGNCNQKFDEWEYAFPDFMSSLTDEYVNSVYNITMISSQTEITRADEKVLSLAIAETYYGFCEDRTFNYTFFTFDSKTGNPLRFDDIVTDRALFSEMLMAYTITPSKYSTTDEYNEALSKLSQDIKDGSEPSFFLYQNCIALALPAVTDNSTLCIVSALDLGSCVDLSYFTQTPTYYSLILDSNNHFTWDFDEDGAVDTIELMDNGRDTYSLDLAITYNGSPMEIVGDYKEDLFDPYSFEYACMSEINGSYYLYIEIFEEDPVNPNLIFKMEDGKFVFIGTTSEFDKYPYDPQEVRINTRSDLLGTDHKTQYCSLIMNAGTPTPLYDFFYKFGVASTTKRMTLVALDEDYNVTDETLDIPAGTAVRLIGVAPDRQYAVFTTLDMNEKENRLFKMLVYPDGYGDFDVAYDLMGQHELFEGMMFAD